jgi:hypothetical protein
MYAAREFSDGERYTTHINFTLQLDKKQAFLMQFMLRSEQNSSFKVNIILFSNLKWGIPCLLHHVAFNKQVRRNATQHQCPYQWHNK